MIKVKPESRLQKTLDRVSDILEEEGIRLLIVDEYLAVEYKGNIYYMSDNEDHGYLIMQRQAGLTEFPHPFQYKLTR